MREKCLDIASAEIRGMAFAVEQNEPARPIDIGVLGADAVMFQTDLVPQTLQQARRLRSGEGSGSHGR